MKIDYEENRIDRTNYLLQHKGKDGQILLPFPAQDQSLKSKFLFKVIYKPESGQLWGFNEYNCDKELTLEQDFQNLVYGKDSKLDTSAAK